MIDNINAEINICDDIDTVVEINSESTTTFMTYQGLKDFILELSKLKDNLERDND